MSIDNLSSLLSAKLREVEWSGPGEICPVCGANRETSLHTLSGCPLFAMLDERHALYYTGGHAETAANGYRWEALNVQEGITPHFTAAQAAATRADLESVLALAQAELGMIEYPVLLCRLLAWAKEG
jgi:hypothetical protein